MDKSSYLVGISGGSGSGKTYFLNELIRRFKPEKVCLISQDNYYKPKSEQRTETDGSINFDHPDAVDMALLHSDIQKLLNGETLKIQEYTFNNATKKPKELTYHPAPIIIIEGLFVFQNPLVSNLFDLTIFIDAEEHVKLSRRIVRDYQERGYELKEVLSRYEAHVIPMYKQYVRPYKDLCDLVIPNNAHMDRATEVILNHLSTLISD